MIHLDLDDLLHVAKLAVTCAVAEAELNRRIMWVDDDLAEQAVDSGERMATSPHVLVMAARAVRGADPRAAGRDRGKALSCHLLTVRTRADR